MTTQTDLHVNNQVYRPLPQRTNTTVRFSPTVLTVALMPQCGIYRL